ncbi:MAG: hypothetical protein OXF88_12075 [Rhodobacteraceae bacterium]|nr:hypothetical protein [Paracoccaceae bacterium]MCY4141038.1 hypothetical protein [Paracoccaceae bacterium]
MCITLRRAWHPRVNVVSRLAGDGPPVVWQEGMRAIRNWSSSRLRIRYGPGCPRISGRMFSIEAIPDEICHDPPGKRELGGMAQSVI